MKSKIFRIIGVVATVAILASTLVAPVLAVSGVSVTLASTDTQISTVNAKYTAFFNIASQLLGNSSGSFTLPIIGDKVSFTSAAATDKVALTVTGAVSVAFAPAVTTGGYASGVISFDAVGQVATITSTAASTVLYKKTVGTAAGPATVTDLTGAPTEVLGAITLPDVGDSIIITAHGDATATLPAATTGAFAVTFSAGTGAYAAGVITFGTSLTATVTATANLTTGTWTPMALGLATAAAGTNVANPIVYIAAASSGDTITLTFPASFTIAAVPTFSIAASDGWVTIPPATVAAFLPAVVTDVVAVGDNTAHTITFTLGQGDYVGETAQIRIAIATGITNSSIAGDYTLTVKTSKETTAIASNPFTLVNPTPTTLPGIVKVMNASGVLVYNDNSGSAITNALAHVVGSGWTITIDPGTYAEGTLTVAQNNLTVKASGAMADTKVGGNWVVNGTGASFTALTFRPGSATNVAVTINAGGAVIDGCSFVKNVLTTAETMVAYSNTTAGTVGTIKNSTFATGNGSVADYSVLVTNGAVGLTVSKNTFNIDIDETLYINDSAVRANATCTVDSNTFNTVGYNGIAVNIPSTADAGTTVTVTNNTFNAGVGAALYVNNAAGNAVFTGNKVDKLSLTEVLWPISTGEVQPITILANGNVTIYQNVFTNSQNATILVGPGATQSKINIMFNEIATSNKLGVINQAAGTTVNATHNYWGAATGPAAGYNAGTYGVGTVDTTGFLGTAVTGGTISLAPAALTAVTNGAVTVTNSSVASYIAIANYAASPSGVKVAATQTAVSFYEVTTAGTTAGANTTIHIAGTTAAPITASSVIVIWNASYGRWDTLTTTASNLFGNYIEAVVPSASLTGTPIALASTNPTVPGVVPAIVPPYMPITGSIDFPVDGTFSWAPVTGATSYDVVVAEDSALTDKFAVINYAVSTPVNGSSIPTDQTLKFDTIYWWRVRAVNAVGPGAWTVGFFTTEKAPVAPPTVGTTTVVTTTIPVVTSVPPPNITVDIPQQEPVQVIPDFLLWAVVAVGVILIIAVIVLIVRTRRVS